MRVLLTGTDRAGGLAALRALRAAGYDPVAAVASDRDHGVRSRAAAGVAEVPDAGEDAHGFAAAIAEAAKREQVQVVLPGSERALVALAAHRDAFPDDVAVGVCSPTTTLVATDKVATLVRAGEAGVRVLLAQVLGVFGPPEPDAVRFPVVVKPLRAGTHQTRRVDDIGELVLALAALPNGAGIVQAYLEGRLLNVNGVAADGEVVAAAHEEALRTWPADCGPVSYARTIAPDARLSEQTGALVDALGWSGIFNLQFIESEAGLFLVDVNPRLHTSIGLAVAAGLNLPAIWVETLLGRVPQVDPYRVGVKFRSEGDVRSLTQLFRSGARSAALAGLMPQRDTTHAIASLSDPRPGLRALRRLPERLVSVNGVPTRAPGL